jgi:hypothetical protein
MELGWEGKKKSSEYFTKTIVLNNTQKSQLKENNPSAYCIGDNYLPSRKAKYNYHSNLYD